MKKDIHPPYVDTLVRCACGTEIATRSTQHDLKVAVCSHCHPAFTGVRKPVNVEGRMERFRRRYRLRGFGRPSNNGR
jgi:large subunit ribosomal protein L31